MIDFSIILIIKDDANLLNCSLHSIERMDFPREQFEVIVIDDGSSRPIQEQISENFSFTLKFQYLPRDEYSCRPKARNIGADLSQGRHLVFIDGDHFLDEKLLHVYQRYFSIKKQRRVVLGKRKHIRHGRASLMLKKLQDKNTPWEVNRRDYGDDERDLLLKHIDEPFENVLGRWHLFWSCNFCIERDLFFEIGGFDENFIKWGLEDVELGYRLQTQNVPFEMIDNYVWHFLHENPITEAKYQGWLDNIQYFYRKYGDVRILEQSSFEDVFFYAATLPGLKAVDWAECFLNFERKLRYLDKIKYPTSPQIKN